MYLVPDKFAPYMVSITGIRDAGLDIM